MILRGHKKRILKEIVKYYVETTENMYEDFIMTIQKNRGKLYENMAYSDWLAIKLFEIISGNGVTLLDCIENKDVIRSAIEEDVSRRDGEFYTPEKWAVEGRKYLQDLLGEKWGEAYIWDASCYTVDTEILTNRGWVTYYDLQSKDLIYALNPETMKGEFVGYKRAFKKYVEEELNHFKSDGVDLLVTKDHSMFVKNNGVDYVFEDANKVRKYLSEGNNSFSVVSSAEIDDADFNGVYDELEGAFWELVGFYLEKGRFIVEDDVVKDILFVLFDRNDMEYLKGLLDKLGIVFEEKFYSSQMRRVDITFMYDKLVKLGLSANFESKRVPFGKLNKKYYKDILRGITGKDKDEINYKTYSKNFAKDVEFLMNMSGYTVSIPVMRKNKYDIDYTVRGTLNKECVVKSDQVESIFYMGYVWDITLDKYHVFKVKRNGVSVFCGNCGTGNLLKTVDYPREKIFMSTLLPEDIEMVNQIMPGVNTFVCDFVNGIDSIYEDRIRDFSNKLPNELLQVLEGNKDLVIFMNPPYKVTESGGSDVGSHMISLGMKKCSLDIFNQFIFRICMLKRTYNLSNLYLGIYGPITLFHSKMLEDLYKEFKTDFTFESGMCFDAGDFSNTSESVGWIVGFTTWKVKNPEDQDRNVLLDAKISDENGVINVIGQRLITNVDENLHNWSFPTHSVMHTIMMPEVSNIFNFTGKYNKYAKNALGCLMSSNFVIRATRRACVTSLPNPGGVDITEDNFWRCVASYGARRAYAIKQNPYNNCQYYSKPSEDVEGYEAWLVDALVLFLFDYNSQVASYRGIEVDKTVMDVGVLDIQNKLFPIDYNIVKEVVTDEKIIQDMADFPAQNQFIVNLLKDVQSKFSLEAYEFYEFCLSVLLASLQGDHRKRFEYAYWTQAWDASLIQIRTVEGFFSKETEERYSYLNARLKDKLLEGVYKYGFMMDTNFSFDKENVENYDEEYDDNGS